ncbi:nucleotidyltransferase domain-containing protein [Streptomyces anulatus]|uniref:nucleotidyltransferase domain-containing protein n=1 Tax=Streptomyces anulatus TaxID=1892 RepID=UPI0033D2D746
MIIPLDPDGHLINLADIGKVGPEWRPVMMSLVDEYRSRYPDLASVYVRGSVATGTAVLGRSDVDLVGVTREEHQVDRTWVREASERTLVRHAAVIDIDLAITSVAAVLGDRKSGFYIKTQSALVHGEDFAPRIAPYRIGPEAFSHLFNLELDLKTVRDAVQGTSDSFARTLIMRLVKRVLRAGLELVAERQQVYTRDPDMCCDIFGAHYPEHAVSMREILDLMSDFSHTADALEKINSCIEWIAAERSRVYPRELPKFAFIDDLGV